MSVGHNDNQTLPGRPRYAAMILINLISMTVSYGLVAFGWTIDLGPTQTERIGGTLTVLLLAVGLICHVQSKKMAMPLRLLMAPALIGPLYAVMAGPARQVVGYHVFTLGIYAFVWYHQRRYFAT